MVAGSDLDAGVVFLGCSAMPMASEPPVMPNDRRPARRSSQAQGAIPSRSDRGVAERASGIPARAVRAASNSLSASCRPLSSSLAQLDAQSFLAASEIAAASEDLFAVPACSRRRESCGAIGPHLDDWR